MKVIAVHVERCLGCKTCVLYCAAERGSQAKELLPAAQESPPPRSRLRVEGTNDSSAPLHCRHCQNAPCLSACLSGALKRDPDSGMVSVDDDKCIACWTCTMFCPYGVIYPWPERGFALKCDRCNHMERPVCVSVCPTRALELVELDELETAFSAKRKLAVEMVTRAGAGGGPVILDLE